MKMVLRTKGHDALDADDGLTGLKIAREQKPDIIISDIHMGNMSGWELLDALRKEPETAAIPFILMTGDSDDMSLRRGMESGADDYLPKPFTMETLLATVEARLKKMDAVRTQAESKLSELRANLSLMLPHELNTPLVGILGFGEIISTCADSLTPAELTEMGQNIIMSGQRLQRMIQNFLLYSQIEMLGAEVRQLHVAQSRSATEARAVIIETAKHKAEQFKRAADLKIALADVRAAISAELLGKIVEELVDNAFKFSPPGTPVTVDAATVGGEFRLSVADQGRGFKSDHVAQVSAYSQFERKIHEQQGSGLGLIIAKRLTELHDGTLKIVSDGRSGTRIEIRLHAADH